MFVWLCEGSQGFFRGMLLDNMGYKPYNRGELMRKETDAMSEYEVIFYETESGKQPAKEFLLSLDPKMRAKMLRTIELAAENGTDLREPYSKPLEDGIFELRAKVGSDISRTLYFFYTGKRIILTNGFVKKTQKTPENEKKLAKKYRADFLSREEKRS